MNQELKNEDKEKISNFLKISEIKREIKVNKIMLELLSFRQTNTIYSLGGSDDKKDCDARKLGKELLTNEEVNSLVINFCPRHFGIYQNAKEKAIKDTRRLEKRLSKLECPTA
jgi:hypothetical protein